MAKGRGHSRAGRPRRTGPRLDNGRLAPPKPNPEVLKARRSILPPGTPYEMGENILDVALANGFITRDRHRAARWYGSLVNNVLPDTPNLKVSNVAKLGGRWVAPRTEAELNGERGSGVKTDLDAELDQALRDLHAGKITERQYALAEKRHRAARINWKGMRSHDVAKIWDAALERPLFSPGPHSDTLALEDGTGTWRQLRERLSTEQLNELSRFCVRGECPSWMDLKLRGLTQPPNAARRRIALFTGLDIVLEKMRDGREHRPQTVVLASPANDPGNRRKGFRITEEVVVLDETGATVREVMKIRRRN